MVYDLIVIGGGPAGYLAAVRAGEAKKKVMLFEKRFIGGVCLNEGCIPSKTLLHSAKILDYTKFGEKYGVSVKEAALDHKTVLKRKNKIVKMLVSGVNAKLKKNGVEIKNSEAIIKGKNTDGFEVEAEGVTYTARQIIIATGSTPIIPPIPGAKEGYSKGFVLTNREMLDLEEIPQRLVVIGGGVIGLEMASYFNSAGSNVVVIEMLENIAGNNDKEISENLLKNYKKKGIEFHLSSRVVEITEAGVVFEHKGEREVVPCDKVLMSVGRRAATEGIGLENIGVEIVKGSVITDDKCQTNVPGVYAAGDINGKSMLAHTAYREAEVAVNNMIGKRDVMRYNAIPYVIYTNPEVAGVGETEESAKSKGIEVETVNISMRYSGRYMAENEGGDGICKVVANKKYKNIIGVHMIGNYSSEIIYGAALMIEMQMKVDDIKELVFPHPTVCEVIREALFEFQG